MAVALSGGLDSAVAASLLKEQHHEVMGIHFLTGHEPAPPPAPPGSGEPASQVEHLASTIGIPLKIIDCSQDFAQKVVGYFLETYHAGQTPNPCVICNREMKFGVVLRHAERLGAEALATGHYARVTQSTEGQVHLLKGMDATKDQSYFLSRLTQEQLRRAIFPLGTYTKNHVRKMAEERGFSPHTEEESQELCFINEKGYRHFLEAHGTRFRGPGPIVDSRGHVLGEHQGLHRHTIGQRRGIGIPGPEPYYVLRLDVANNRLLVGTKAELTASACTVKDINWIGVPPPDHPLTVQTRIRYRHKEAPSVVTPMDAVTAKVTFIAPQQAITPGQAAVFYDGERVLGGGWICEPEPDGSL